jgi:15-cis-phytoene synthase
LADAFGVSEFGLDRIVRRGDLDRWLASRFIGDHARRADVIALYAYEIELSRACRATLSNLLAEIRLAWWREALDEIFGARLVRRHPTAHALALAVSRRGLPREPLEAMIDARVDVLGTPAMGADEASRWAVSVCGSICRLASCVLDPASPAEAAAVAGKAWGLAQLRGALTGSGEAFGHRLSGAIETASLAVRNMSVAAFPAVAYLTLVRAAPRVPSELEKRMRLLWSVSRGRI